MPILAIFAAIAVAAYVLGQSRNSATSFDPPHDEAPTSPWAQRHGHSRALGDLPWALPIVLQQIDDVVYGPEPTAYRLTPFHPVVTLGLLDGVD